MSKKQKTITIVAIFITMIFNGLMIFSNNNNIYSNFPSLVKYELFMLLTCFLSYFIYVRYINKKDFNKTFIFIYVIIGLFYLFLFPVNSLLDESHHFYRTYEISNGHLVSGKTFFKEGYFGTTYISENAYKVSQVNSKYKDNLKVIHLKETKNQKLKRVELTNTSMYSFVCYTPQVIGLLIGKTLNLPILYWIYLARLCNFLVFVLLLYFSLKNIPFKKATIMFIVLMPMALQQAISLGADSMTLGASLAFISYVLKLMYSDKKVEKKDYLILYALCLVIALSKIIYVPLCMLVLFIPKEKFNSKKEKYLKLGTIIFVSFALNLMWLSIATSYLAALNESGKQFEYIIHNPFKYIYVMINTFLTRTDYFFKEMIGRDLGNYEVTVSTNYLTANIFVIFFLLLFDNNKNIKLTNKFKLGNVFAFFSILVLMYTSLYLDWTSYKNELVQGIQGRYFLPLFFLIFLVFSSNNFNIKNKKVFNKYYLLLFMVVENVYIITLLSLYYNFSYV